MERPDGKTEIINLLDNGAGADSTLNDGIYTQYYTNPPVQGRYTLKCVVTNTPATVIDDCKNQILQTNLLPTNSIRFNRIQSGGSFKVINVISYLKTNFIFSDSLFQFFIKGGQCFQTWCRCLSSQSSERFESCVNECQSNDDDN